MYMSDERKNEIEKIVRDTVGNTEISFEQVPSYIEGGYITVNIRIEEPMSMKAKDEKRQVIYEAMRKVHVNYRVGIRFMTSHPPIMADVNKPVIEFNIKECIKQLYRGSGLFWSEFTDIVNVALTENVTEGER